MPNPVVTRFAPSPTGFLHIGGARTALFNWAFARANAGKFLLRIEDTDRARSSDEAIDAILNGMDWLGLNADERVVYQSQQAERHVEVAHMLLDAGHAYVSSASDDEVATIRAAAREDGVAARYPGRDGALSRTASDGHVVRFKAPIEGETIVRDKVQGDVVFRNDQLDDLVLLRSDGTPTYMLAVVVDDHDMGVTHIIRGDDHLTNAARQSQIYTALQWDIPDFAHIPLIHGSDGAKLSKRHGALGAETYREMGYLSEAMINYLVRLGWSHGDDEIIPRQKIVEWFDLEGINKAPSRFDIAKLQSINVHYIRGSDDDRLIDELRFLVDHHLEALGLRVQKNEIDMKKIRAALPFLRDRAKTLIELIFEAQYLFISRPIELDEKSIKQLSSEGVENILRGIHTELDKLSGWSKETIEGALKTYASDHDLKFGKIAPPLRAALTGSTVSPGIYDVLYSLGKTESLLRIGEKMAEKDG